MNTDDNELPILLLNPNDVDVTIKANTVIARAEEVTPPSEDTMPTVAKVHVRQKPHEPAGQRLAQIASVRTLCSPTQRL